MKLRKADFLRNPVYALPLYSLVLAATLYFAYFHPISGLGLYDDDFWYIPPQIGANFQAILGWIHVGFTKFDHGRPIHIALAALLPWIGQFWGNLTGMYLLAFLIQCANAFLFFSLLRKYHLELTAWIAPFFLLLIPVDTNRLYLTYSFVVQTAMTFALIGHLLLSRRKLILGYLAGLFTLWTYQSFFFIFALLPILDAREQAKRKKWLRLLPHLLICLAILIPSLLLQYLSRDDYLVHVKHFSGSEILFRFAVSITAGPWTVFHGTLYRIGENLKSPITFGGAGAITIIAIYLIDRDKTSDHWSAYGERVACAILLMMATYLSAPFVDFHYPPTMLVTRATTIHSAALIGGAILFGTFFEYLILQSQRIKILQFATVVLLGISLSSLMSEGRRVHADYTLAWSIQRQFWTKMREALERPLQDQTFAIVDARTLPKAKYINAYTLATFPTFNNFFQSQGPRTPRVYVWTLNIPSFIASLDFNNGKPITRASDLLWFPYIKPDLDPCRLFIFQFPAKDLSTAPEQIDSMTLNPSLICKHRIQGELPHWELTQTGRFVGLPAN